MKNKFGVAVTLLISAVVFSEGAAGVPNGFGQLENPPRFFRAGHDEDGIEYALLGQPSTNKKLIFTASNGFFTKGACRAGGESRLPKVGDADLVRANYEYLHNWKGDKALNGTIRWHVRITQPGTVRFAVRLAATSSQAGSTVRIAFAGMNRQRVVKANPNEEKAQPWKLRFRVRKPGDYTFSLQPLEIKDRNDGVGQLYTIDAYGTAIEGAQLLRARWRPAAVFDQYAGPTPGGSKAWIVESRSLSDTWNYSPMSTPFGYFGSVFRADRRAEGSFNFSMWAAGAGAQLPPLTDMPRLLTIGSPEGQFGSFGHEGTGVKVRGWIALPNRPAVVVQALRVERDGESNTYYGHIWDQSARQWKLFAVGRKRGKALSHLPAKSFCEIVGAPHATRDGDSRREVRRKGWALDNKGVWQRMNRQLGAAKRLDNKQWRTTEDGEFAMSTGGLRFYPARRPGQIEDVGGPKPEYLQPAVLKQLYVLPVEFGVPQVVANNRTSVVLSIPLKKAGTNARGVLFYGEKDCHAFAVPVGSSAPGERSWRHRLDVDQLKNGDNRVEINGLTPGQTYYYRMLVTNEEGRMWHFETYQFRAG